jgi:CTP:molybdopterin cytidylyltransferase MocA
MGSPKALVAYRGKPFLEHLLEVTRHPAIGVRRVVLGPDAEAIRNGVALRPEETVLNADWEKGQLSSIQAALRTLPETVEGMLLCPVDHPLVSSELVASLIENFLATKAPVVVPQYGGRRGHPVIFSAAVFEELMRAPLEQGARAVVWAYEKEIQQVPTTEEGCVLNLNDAAAMERLPERP